MPPEDAGALRQERLQQRLVLDRLDTVGPRNLPVVLESLAQKPWRDLEIHRVDPGRLEVLAIDGILREQRGHEVRTYLVGSAAATPAAGGQQQLLERIVQGAPEAGIHVPVDPEPLCARP